MTNVVSSQNEWDPLEEVIVGRIEESVHPPHEKYVLGGVPEPLYGLLKFIGGRKKRPHRLLVEPARRELEGFVRILEGEGVTVRRPDVLDHGKSFGAPWWSSRGHSSACPRDCFLVVGDEIIEAPMSWRNRYHERHAYYALFKDYFDRGARWTSPPKPPLRDSLYRADYTVPKEGEPLRYVINESEVVFDGADFVRCGRDLFGIRSNATNRAGFTWLRRHLGERYRIHEIETRHTQPMHIDTTFMPLAPGKVMINPAWVDRRRLPPVLRSWDVLEAPEPEISCTGLLSRLASMCSGWVSMNVLMLDEKRVIVEKSQMPMIRSLKEWGFQPVTCAFLHFNQYGGGFHCATLDIRRRGPFRSYFEDIAPDEVRAAHRPEGTSLWI